MSYRIKRISTNEKEPLLDSPFSVICYKNSLWVTNSGNNQVLNFDLKGKLLSSIVVPGNEGIKGITVNTSKGFVINQNNKSASADLIISSSNGSIYGYNSLIDEENAYELYNDGAASFLGLGVFEDKLFVANKASKKIVVFDTDMNVISTDINYAFIDAALPLDYYPTNIKRIGLFFYVTYENENGGGAMNIFNFDGILIQHLLLNEELAGPYSVNEGTELFEECKMIVGNTYNGTTALYKFTEPKHGCDQFPEDLFEGYLTDECDKKCENSTLVIPVLRGQVLVCNKLYYVSGENTSSELGYIY